MTRKNLLAVTAAALLTGNVFAAQVTQFLKVSVTENSNVTVQQTFSMLYAFSLSGTDGLDANDMGNQYSISNPGDDVYPFSLSSNSDIIIQQDARPDLGGYKRIQMGFLSKFPSTIKVIASAFGNTADSTNRPTYAYIEQISTGLKYYFLNDTAKLEIPANLNYVADFYLHTGPASILVEQVEENCFGAFDGSITVHNTNCTAWNLTVYKNSNLYSCDSIFQADTTLYYLGAGTYTLITSVNSIDIDSTTITMTSEPQIIVDFSMDNNIVTTDDAVNFYDMSPLTFSTMTYAWDFGDGNGDVLPSTSYQYSIPGTYEVTLTLTSLSGCSATNFDSVYVSPGMTVSNSFNQVLTYNSSNNSTITSLSDTMLVKPHISFEMFTTEVPLRIMVAQNEEPQMMSVMILSMSGQLISLTETAEAKVELEVPATGAYIVRVMNAKKEVQSKTIMVTN
jgi:PKD repeat protein